MRRYNRFFYLLLLLLCCCGGGQSKGGFEIGIDPTWTPFEFGDREQNVTAFSTELLREIGKVEKISLTKINVAWDNLLPGLKKGKYQAIISSMPPQLYNLNIYDFSDSYLPIGPVLVVRADSAIDGLKSLDGKEVGVISNSGDEVILQQAPGVLIREYMRTPVALNDVANETIDAAMIDILTATAYCQDIYQGQLKVATAPLSNAGLRLIALHGKQPELLDAFNRGLNTLQSSGKYSEMLQKWNLLETPPSQ